MSEITGFMLLLIKLLKNAYPSEQVMKLLIKDVKREANVERCVAT